MVGYSSGAYWRTRYQDSEPWARPALLDRALKRGRRARLAAALTGRSRRLFSLAEVQRCCTFGSSRDAGMQMVPLDRICGSEGRCKDFDRDFNPLHDRSISRWLSVARARQDSKCLPPVELVQVGNVFFVRDGHHRVSVARARGEKDIEAEVTVWQATGALPWDDPETADEFIREQTVLQRLRRQVQDSSARLRDSLLLRLCQLLTSTRRRLQPPEVSPSSPRRL